MSIHRPVKFLVLLLFSFISVGTTYADHYGAGDIKAEYIGTAAHPLRYVVTLYIYRACEAGQALFGPTEGGYYESVSTGFAKTNVTYRIIPGLKPNGSPLYTDTLDQLCPAFKDSNSCRSLHSSYPGFNRFTLTDTFDLPHRAADWHWVWTTCCRNTGISNLCQPNNQYILVDCYVNNLFKNTNSPQFTAAPIPYVCLNQPDQFFNGPYDPDGDSLFVENVSPIGSLASCNTGCVCGPNAELGYKPAPTNGIPYSLINPIQSRPAGYIVDPLTGIASFTPSLIGKYVIAFKCSKYDHITKTFLGSTRRDVQVSVLGCIAPPPIIDSLPTNIVGGLVSPQNGNIIYACPNSQLSFTMQAKSSSGTNVVFLNIDTTISRTPGNTFNVPNNGQSTVNGNYTWTPGDTSLGVHTLVFFATDSTCNNAQPIVLKNYLVVTVFVISGINAIPKIYRNCPLAQVPTMLNVSGLPSNFTYKWTNYNGGGTAGITNFNTPNPTVQPRDTTKYIVTVPGLPATCKTADTVVVNVDTSNHIHITPATPILVCRAGIITLTANANGNKPVSNLTCGMPIAAVDTTHPDSAQVLPVTGFLAGSTNAAISCDPFGSHASVRHQYIVRAADMINSGVVSGSISAMTLNIGQVSTNTTYRNFQIAIRCDTNSRLPADGSLLSMGVPVFYSPSFSINAAGNIKFVFSSLYNWDTTQNLIVDLCYSNNDSSTTNPNPPAITYYNSGYPSSSFVYSDTTSVCAAGAFAHIGGYPRYELPAIQFNFYDAPTVPFPYAWQRSYGSNYLSDTTAQSPLAGITKSSKYYVVSRGKSGCSFRDSVNIYLDPARQPSITPGDTTVCIGGKVQLVASYAKNGYQWYQNGGKTAITLDNPKAQKVIASPDSNVTYSAIFTDSVNCKDTAYAKVEVIQYPKLAVPGDTTIKYGSSLQLKVLPDSSSYQYVWNPPYNLDNPYIYNPIATPGEPTVYSVIVYNRFCTSYDTVRVGIDYTANILVPSAFTPNNDGKNDVFRVANLTYEKIAEFRVFNRWGQQVFTAVDNHGWDGTWNGVKLDLGVYNYLIRIVFPDGNEQTYTGSVTLIR